MLIRRCAVLLLEPRETLEFDLDLLLGGGSGLRATLQWFALAPHLAGEVEVDAAQRDVLGAIGETQWQDRGTLDARHGAEVVSALLEAGLLVGDGDAQAALRARDDKLRDTCWRPLSAVAHAFSRWDGVDAESAARASGLHTTADLAERYGAPPPHFHARSDASVRQSLPRPAAGDLDRLLQRRTTCRNFDLARPLGQAQFAHLLHTVFAAQAVLELAPGISAVKKTSPSGGSLHATEAYLLVRRVDGVASGLYHYHAGEHALEPLPGPQDDDALRALALRFVAGQHWFADAHVQVILAPRFRRSFWKYRNHAKAYRALILDAGHLSQTMYLAATELGLGAFITAAVNEIEIERAFGLDGLDEGALAVCGFGWRGSERTTVEFDPLHQVWPD